MKIRRTTLGAYGFAVQMLASMCFCVWQDRLSAGLFLFFLLEALDTIVRLAWFKQKDVE